ncbi:MAG TPA: response regulator [Thermomicrobiales bacterium]|nr:response regulator [Thermomicrobiales bacterium]
MRILLVEDEPHVRIALSRTLIAWGYQVTEAATGRDALATLAAAAFDLLILDVNLPDATGWDVMRGLSTTPSAQSPVIVISAVPPSSARIREFRPFGVLMKPFPIEALHRLVRNAEAGEPAHAVGTESD